MQSSSRKRKPNETSIAKSSSARKRQKNYDARIITTETVDPALSTTGELNITSFIKSREYEIDALDRGMRKARQGLMSRAFQQVPRHLRRRTASHNVKKVPRRLRKRAEREVETFNFTVMQEC
jgi:ribonuclease P/MRP protein subunit POP1